MALDRKTYVFQFGVSSGVSDPLDRVSFTKDRTVFERVDAIGQGISLFNEDPVSADDLEAMRILRTTWIRYLNFPCFLGGFMDGGSDTQRDVAYLINVVGPTQQERDIFRNIPAGYDLTLEFASAVGGTSRTFISGIRGMGDAGEIYTITNPGRIDSDGITQYSIQGGEAGLVVPELPSSPETTVRKGNIKVTEAVIEGPTVARSITQGANTIIVPQHVAREYVEGTAYGVDFSLPDTSGVITIDGEQYLLQNSTELSPRKFQVSLLRNISETT